MSIPSTIGERIRLARLESGYSQEELAHKLGRAGRSYISKIERNERDLDHSEIASFSKILNVSVDYIVFGNEQEAVQLSEDEMHLVNNFRGLNKEGKAKLIEYSNDILDMNKYKKCAHISEDIS